MVTEVKKLKTSRVGHPMVDPLMTSENKHQIVNSLTEIHLPTNAYLKALNLFFY